MTTLNERIAAAGPKRIAFVGLSRGAGKTTALKHALDGLAANGISAGIVSAGRRDEDLEAMGGPARLVLTLPQGTVVASTGPALSRSTAEFETIEKIDCSTSVGQVIVSRILKAGDVEVIGPGTGPDLARAVAVVHSQTKGPVLIEGSLARKAFSAPGVADAVVLAIGAGLAPSMDRVIPAARYYLSLFSAPVASSAAAPVFERATLESRCILVSPDWAVLDSFHWMVRDNAPSFLGRRDMANEKARAVIPQIVTDELVIPLLRENLPIEFVVRDPMRNAMSPVYHSAWEKRGGGVSVIHRAELLAAVTNPINPTGPDYDAKEFFAAISEGLPDLPIHDVVQEEQDALPKKRWFGLRSSI